MNTKTKTSNRIDWIKARLVFLPTLFWNALLGRWLKIRSWWNRVDSTVIIGALPFPSDVESLAAEGVRGVVNTCEEYQGPLKSYQEHGITSLRIPTIDYTHPAYDDVCKAVEFIEDCSSRGESVYVHCKAGRGRSATVVICWMIKSKQISKEQAQVELLQVRPFVNKHLTSRPVVIQFEEAFLKS